MSLDCEFDFSDDVLSPFPPSIDSFGLPNCELLCSSISIVSDVHTNQTQDGVSVHHLTCDIIYDEYVRDSMFGQEFVMKVSLSPSSPLPHYPNIYHDSIALVEYFEESVSNNVNYDHT